MYSMGFPFKPFSNGLHSLVFFIAFDVLHSLAFFSLHWMLLAVSSFIALDGLHSLAFFLCIGWASIFSLIFIALDGLHF